MDIEVFWRMVDAARSKAGDDLDKRVEELRKNLSGLDPDELQQFQNTYDEQIRRSHRWDLWGAAYLMNGGCSDDGFRYFCDWLISEGRNTFEKALESPDSLAALPKVATAELELFGYVALGLFEEKTARILNRDAAAETASPDGEPWDEEELPSLFPRLNAIYGS